MLFDINSKTNNKELIEEVLNITGNKILVTSENLFALTRFTTDVKEINDSLCASINISGKWEVDIRDKEDRVIVISTQNDMKDVVGLYTDESFMVVRLKATDEMSKFKVTIAPIRSIKIDGIALPKVSEDTIINKLESALKQYDVVFVDSITSSMKGILENKYKSVSYVHSLDNIQDLSPIVVFEFEPTELNDVSRQLAYIIQEGSSIVCTSSWMSKFTYVNIDVPECSFSSMYLNTGDDFETYGNESLYVQDVIH